LRIELRIFGPKREEYGSYKKLHNDELNSLYTSPNVHHHHHHHHHQGLGQRPVPVQNFNLRTYESTPNVVRVIKSKRMRWVLHVALMGEGRGVYRILVRRPEGKRPLGRLGVFRRITLRWALGR
jgi:hypothetical protein